MRPERQVDCNHPNNFPIIDICHFKESCVKSFIGRTYELKQLEDLQKSPKARLVVIKGRRRIGKSRLIQEFAKDKVFLSFSGIAPIDKVTAQDQRDTFALQLSKATQTPLQSFTDWAIALDHLTHQLTDKPCVILLDEISWMGSCDPTFVPKLKNWWDLQLLQLPNVTLVFCGSVSTWIEENIINSTAFFGRISLYVELSELSISESYEFLTNAGINYSAYDIFKLLSITGGVPWYLEQTSKDQTADENITRLCFQPNGLLVHEFDRIFYDLFLGKGNIYVKIIHTLSEGMNDMQQIKQALHYPDGGTMSHYLKELMISGYVDEHYTWSIKTGKTSRQKLFRLSDNYLRFYLKYIEPNKDKIKRGVFKQLAINQLPGFDTMMGFQVETLLLRNRPLLLKAMNIDPTTIVADNPYVQKPTERKKGCQIDYLIQTRSNTLFVCEFKFQRRELDSGIIDDMKDKIARLARPKNYGAVPVLFHVGGVSKAVHEAQCFYKIIDMADFL
jgi:AAA+ ATPase superfamily predicted ATPase